ncbi:hypothetical protein N9L68_02090 [bacterium]|nr:hypothetical protein [bacterium]
MLPVLRVDECPDGKCPHDHCAAQRCRREASRAIREEEADRNTSDLVIKSHGRRTENLSRVSDHVSLKGTLQVQSTWEVQPESTCISTTCS